MSDFYRIHAVLCREKRAKKRVMAFALILRSGSIHSVCETIGLRPAIEADAAFILSLEARPEVSERIGRLRPGDPRLESHSIIEDGSEPVGVVGIVRSKISNGEDVQLFCAVVSEREGCGIATKACRAMMDEYLLRLSASRIVAIVAPDNAAGRAIARKLGLVRLACDPPTGDYVFALPVIGSSSD